MVVCTRRALFTVADDRSIGDPKMNVAREEAATDVDEISAALYQSWREPSQKRDTDVDEISAALYQSWREPSQKRDTDVDEISAALYNSWEEVSN